MIKSSLKLAQLAQLWLIYYAAKSTKKVKPMRPILLILFSLIAFAASAQQAKSQILYYPTAVVNHPYLVGINWNAECAVQAATGFQSCKLNGGRTWPCAIAAGLSYWNCSGSNFESSFRRVSKVRAGVVGMRAARRGR